MIYRELSICKLRVSREQGSGHDSGNGSLEGFD